MNRMTKAINELLPFLYDNHIKQINGVDVAIPYLMGIPGGGKTSMIKHFCEQSNWNCIDIHFALIPIEEIGGIPQFYDVTTIDPITNESTVVKGTQWSIPDLITLLWKVSNSNDKPVTVCFLDDYHLCSPSHYALGFELFKRNLRGHSLPPNVAFILAGNPSSKAGSKTLPSFISNRVSLLPVHTDFEYWHTKYAIPAQVNSKIITFLNHGKYKKHFHQEEQINQPWASPRSWTRLGNELDSLEGGDPNNPKEIDSADLLYYASSYVGKEAAQEFAEYYKLFIATDMINVFNGTKSVNIPKEFANQYIYCFAAVSEFFNLYLKKDKKDKKQVVDKMAEVLVKLGLVTSELVVSALKNIVDTQMALGRRSIYEQVKNSIGKINPKVLDKIRQDIDLI